MESEQVLARAARSGMVGLARARPVSLGSPLVGDRCKGQCQVGLVFGEGVAPAKVAPIQHCPCGYIRGYVRNCYIMYNWK